jgi:hypothetical protein
MTEITPTAWFYCYSNGCEGLIERQSGPLPYRASLQCPGTGTGAPWRRSGTLTEAIAHADQLAGERSSAERWSQSVGCVRFGAGPVAAPEPVR